MGKITNQSNVKELALTESRVLRDAAVESVNVDFLNKIKAIQYLTADMILSIDQIANYYEVSKKSVETIISRNREEFEQDGMKILSGDELKDFKKIINEPSNEGASIGSRVNSFTILTKRSMLRVGLIMTNCTIATKIRNYLLNLEEISTQEQKTWALQREVSKIDRRRLTDAIQKYIPETSNKKFAYPTYTNLIYRTLFGKDAKQMKEERNLKTNDLLRDSFGVESLKNIDEAETIVTALVALGFSYEQIKVHLRTKFGSFKLTR